MSEETNKNFWKYTFIILICGFIINATAGDSTGAFVGVLTIIAFWLIRSSSGSKENKKARPSAIVHGGTVQVKNDVSVSTNIFSTPSTDFDPMSNAKRILIIDDDQFLLNMYFIKFQKAGFNVATRSSANDDGESFVDTIAKLRPDLISLDIIMPGRNGFEAMKLLQNDARTKHIPIFFLTNMGQPRDINIGLKLGAAGYVICAQAIPSEVVKIYTTYLANPQQIKKLHFEGLHFPKK